jgi:asparaginyl-tRNA synthetase
MIKDILEKYKIGEKITINGRIFKIRKQATITFIELKDGSTIQPLQCIFDELSDPNLDIKIIQELNRLDNVLIEGEIVKSPAAGQEIELKAFNIQVLGKCDPEFPISKGRLTLDYLRTIPDKRIFTDTIQAVMRIRSRLAMLVHNFFDSKDFYYIHTPILTSNDCEGAGETFSVVKFDDKGKDTKFFDKDVNLTVSGQLNLETIAMGLSRVYTFGPTFRAENSNTQRHLAEFWMIEPELLYCKLEDLMQLAEDFVKYCINGVLEKCKKDLEFLDKWGATKDISKILHLINTSEFIRLEYTEAIKILEKAVEDRKVKFENNIKWGDDLSREHEVYLTDTIYGKPVFTWGYPSKIKSFYMKERGNGTVESYDLLLPSGIGELIGGSVREENYEILKDKMEKLNIDIPWYLDTRKNGTAPHGGFGLGFERLVMLCTGMKNIRDVIPYPRFPKHCDC